MKKDQDVNKIIQKHLNIIPKLPFQEINTVSFNYLNFINQGKELKKILNYLNFGKINIMIKKILNDYKIVFYIIKLVIYKLFIEFIKLKSKLIILKF